MSKNYNHFYRQVEEVLLLLKKVKRNGNGWIALCPAHEDKKPSLSIGKGEDGKALLHCFAGCTYESIITALGLSSRSSYFSYSKPSSPSPSSKQPLTIASLAAAKGLPKEFLEQFAIEDTKGITIHYKLPDGSLHCRQRLRTALKAKDGSGWTGKGEVVPYGLWRLQEFREGENPYLLLVEGETDTWTLWYHGFQALGIPGASMAGKLRPEYLEGFEMLYICQEPDQGGEAFVRGVLQQLKRMNWKGTAKIIPFSKEIKDLNGLHVNCQQKGQDFKVALGKAISEAVEAEIASLTSVCEEDWPDPVLLSGTHPVPPFSAELLPEAFRDWVVDTSTRQGIPIEFLAVSAMVAAAAAVGNQRTIQPKRKDNWVVIPSLWGMIVGRPGSMKTQALQEALRPLRKLESAEIERYEALKTKWDKEEELRSLQRKALEEEIRRASKVGEDVSTLVAKMQTLKTVSPVCKRYIVNDCTVEKLGELLAQNPNGLLIFRDELAGLLRTMEKQGHEADRAFFLEAWNRNASFLYDRIVRGTVVIKKPTLSILGGIQPDLLKAYLINRSSPEEGLLRDGWLQRFQLLVYLDSTEWRFVDCAPNTVAFERATAVFEKLTTLGTNGVKGSLRFSSEAQEYFNNWITGWEEFRRNPEPCLESHLVKYRSLMPSLALICHLIDSDSTALGSKVSLAAAQRAAAWCDFLREHAVRVYGLLIQHSTSRSVESLAAHIKKGDLPNQFSARDVLRHHWADLMSPKEVASALAYLEELGWVHSARLSTGGRPSSRYLINPKLRK